ncbi:MAG: DUF362 domain-containing protein [Deltaproteobacteria bacterium]
MKISDEDNPEIRKNKLSRLLDESRILDFFSSGEQAAVKMHFGEEGNTGFVRPEYVKEVCTRIIRQGAIPYLSDTNTLYPGRRLTSREHARLAREHGFSKEAVGADLVIPDDKKAGETARIEINQKFIDTAKVAAFFCRVSAIVGLAHFKGHMMTSFGGALKNVGMGCAAREGKLAQHSDVSPEVIADKCAGCAACQEACPVQAIVLIKKRSHIDAKKCIGCANCIAACPHSAIEINWESGGNTIQEKMVEYAKAALKGKERNSAFINFAVKITKECDCLAKDDPKISPDVGIFASRDPVSIDKASYDLVIKTCGKDIFKEAHPKRDGFKQLRHAAEIGLGNLEYELIEIP